MAQRPSHVGQQLGNYRLTTLLGAGGFAQVYMGEHIRLRTQAAIKVLHTHVSPEEIEKFQYEAQTIANLVHPHIVRILDFDVTNGLPFLVMEYCPDGTLRKCHPRGERVPLPTVVAYIKQVAEALQYAHDQKIIHRDIKPENMLLGQQKALLLSDFGIAAAAHSTHSMRTQDFAGTAAYMAPEQIKRYPRRESDQYALALVTYEWLAGSLPFVGTPEEVVIKHLAVEPPSLCQIVPHLSKGVEEVVMKALAKDPHQRFASVQDFATALEQASQSNSQALEQAIVKFPSQPQLIAQIEIPPVQTKKAPEIAYPNIEAHNQSQSSPGNPRETEQVQQLEQVKKEKLYNTVRRGLIYASLINSICVSIALSRLLHSWLVLGGGILGGLILTGITAASAKNEKIDDQGIWSVSLLLIFPLAWGYVGWLCDSFMSHMIYFVFLPQILGLVGLAAGCLGYSITCAFTVGDDYKS